MPPRREYLWDARAGRYRDARTRRYVSEARVRLWLDEALENAEKRVDALASALRSGSVDLVTWQIRMARKIKNVQLYSAAAVKGGWAQLSPADLGRVGQSVRAQLEYLNRFAQQIKRGEQALDGRLNLRARQYANSGRQLYHRIERLEKETRGFTQERNLRYAGDSCAGCVEQTARGWVKIGTLVPVGQRLCRGACKCLPQYR